MSAVGPTLPCQFIRPMPAIGGIADSARIPRHCHEPRSSRNIPASTASNCVRSQRHFVTRHLRDGGRLRFNAHLALSLGSIARTMALTQRGGQCAGRSERHASLMAAIGGEAHLTRTSQIRRDWPLADMRVVPTYDRSWGNSGLRNPHRYI
jgi:hypothetical protein